jgi:flagellar biosynthesis/type III secretory pathway ATPase
MTCSFPGLDTTIKGWSEMAVKDQLKIGDVIQITNPDFWRREELFEVVGFEGETIILQDQNGLRCLIVPTEIKEIKEMVDL